MLVLGRLARGAVLGMAADLILAVCECESEDRSGPASFKVRVGVQAESSRRDLLLRRLYQVMQEAMRVAADRRFAALNQFLTDLSAELGVTIRLDLEGMTPGDLATMQWCCFESQPLLITV